MAMVLLRYRYPCSPSHISLRSTGIGQLDQIKSIHVTLNHMTLLQTHHNLGWRMECSITTIDSVGELGVPLLAVLVIR
jgi:hypothetical protein